MVGEASLSILPVVLGGAPENDLLGRPRESASTPELLENSWKVSTISPKLITSPSRNGQGPVRGVPLTAVPLALPRSRTTKRSFSHLMLA